MSLLLDTHAVVWWACDSPRLSPRARHAIAESQRAFVSAATAWEIGTKSRLGKLVWPAEAGSVATFALSQGFEHLAITLPHAERSTALPWPHRDPFDRLLVAQALAEDLTLVSNEALFDATGVRRLW